jgi:hypothetical protein
MKISGMAATVSTLGVLVAVAGPSQATTPTMSRTVSLVDSTFPGDTTWSLHNTFTSATSPLQIPAASHLDLARVNLAYSPTTHLLEVDWVSTTDLTNYNCPVIQKSTGARCSFSLTLFSAPGGVSPSLTANTDLAFTGNPWLSAAGQSAASYGDGEWQGNLKVSQAETFGHHHVIWVAIPRGTTTDERPGTLQPDGSFTSVGAARVDDPFFIDAKHDIATLIDWTDARPSGAPDLSLS